MACLPAETEPVDVGGRLEERTGAAVVLPAWDAAVDEQGGVDEGAWQIAGSRQRAAGRKTKTMHTPHFCTLPAACCHLLPRGPITFPVPTLKKNFLHMKSTQSD